LGYVRGSDTPAIAAAIVVAMAITDTFPFTTTTDVYGYYFLELPPGSYQLRAEAAGYRPSNWLEVIVISWISKQHDFLLQRLPPNSTRTATLTNTPTPTRTPTTTPTATSTYTSTPTKIPSMIYLPLICKSIEPNDSCQSAYGPLHPNELYKAYIWTETDEDYYWITPTIGITIVISLTHIPRNADYDLYLYDETCSSLLARSDNYGNTEERIEYGPTSSRHIIRVRAFSGYSSEEPYYLLWR
jgi:hypothetical protein